MRMRNCVGLLLLSLTGALGGCEDGDDSVCFLSTVYSNLFPGSNFCTGIYGTGGSVCAGFGKCCLIQCGECPGFSQTPTTSISISRTPSPSISPQPFRFIVDAFDSADTIVSGAWISGSALNAYLNTYRYVEDDNTAAIIMFPPNLEDGIYNILIWYPTHAGADIACPVAITHANGRTDFLVNLQQNQGMWNHLGTFRIDRKTTTSVAFVGAGLGGDIVVDAIMFEFVQSATPSRSFSSSISLTTSFTSSGTGSVSFSSTMSLSSSVSATQSPTTTVSSSPSPSPSACNAATFAIGEVREIDTALNGTLFSFNGLWLLVANPLAIHGRYHVPLGTGSATFSLVMPRALYQIEFYIPDAQFLNAEVEIEINTGRERLQMNVNPVGGWNLVGEVSLYCHPEASLTVTSGEFAAVADAIHLTKLGAALASPSPSTTMTASATSSLTTSSSHSPTSSASTIPSLTSSVSGSISVSQSFSLTASPISATGSISVSMSGSITPSITTSNSFSTSFQPTQSPTVSPTHSSSNSASQSFVDSAPIVLSATTGGAQFIGAWSLVGTTQSPGGGYYRTPANSGAVASFLFDVRAGSYELFLYYIPFPYLDQNVAIAVSHSGGLAVVNVDMTQHSGSDNWEPLGEYVLNGQSAITITAPTSKQQTFIVLDSVRINSMLSPSASFSRTPTNSMSSSITPSLYLSQSVTMTSSPTISFSRVSKSISKSRSVSRTRSPTASFSLTPSPSAASPQSETAVGVYVGVGIAMLVIGLFACFSYKYISKPRLVRILPREDISEDGLSPNTPITGSAPLELSPEDPPIRINAVMSAPLASAPQKLPQQGQPSKPRAQTLAQSVELQRKITPQHTITEGRIVAHTQEMQLKQQRQPFTDQRDVSKSYAHPSRTQELHMSQNNTPATRLLAGNEGDSDEVALTQKAKVADLPLRKSVAMVQPISDSRGSPERWKRPSGKGRVIQSLSTLPRKDQPDAGTGPVIPRQSRPPQPHNRSVLVSMEVRGREITE